MTSPIRQFRRFRLGGDMLARMQDWGVRHCPFYLEYVLVFFYTTFFFLISLSPRRSVMANLAVLVPGSSRAANFLRAFRVYINFAWSMIDTARARLDPDAIDWDIAGLENFAEIGSLASGAIVITAHMGSYDLAAPVFARRFPRKLNAVRAPEREVRLQDYVEGQRRALESDAFSIRYNRPGNMLGIELAQALAAGEIVAIQGDRLLSGVAALDARLNGYRYPVPKGPFALAAATGCPLYPVFVLRVGWRHYRIMVGKRIDAGRRPRDTARDAGVHRAVNAWTNALHGVLREHWSQWFVFESAFHPVPEAPGSA
jgi:predicted LPLAT superfamily acyltransferase